MIAIFDRSQKYNIHLNDELKKNLLGNVESIIKNYFKVYEDNGDKLRGIILILSMTKNFSIQFYKEAIKIIILQHNQISLKNHVTMMESLIYNKILLNTEVIDTEDFLKYLQIFDSL